MKAYLFLILGGIVGVVARYQIGLWITGATISRFPWATLAINVTGSLVLGFFARYFTINEASVPVRLMLTTGFCGGFTTLSTFSLEFVNLFLGGELAIAALYMGLTVVLSPLACFAGFALASAVA